MISLSALLTKYTLGIMSNLGNNHPAGAAGAGGGGGGGHNSAAEGSMERGSCLLRYASQNSLDESSQKHIQRPNGKDRAVGSYQNELHTARSFEAMNEMRKQNLLCDVTLIANDIEIPAHKMVLASCSPYFYAMFTGFEESRQERITIQGVDHRALELLIEYVYTATVEVNEDNVQVLLTAANLLQLTDVREACCDYLQTQLDASNCLGIREFADMHGCVDLYNYAENYIEHNFNDVIQFDEFLNLTHDQVMNLIRNDRISVPSEEKVYECVISWIRYDPTMREQRIAELMEHVRLPFLSKEYITQRVDKEPLLDGNIICKNLIIEALTYHLLPNDTKSARTIPRKPVGLPKILLVIGGQAPKAIRSVECYDLREEKWYQAAEMPNRRCRAGLSVLGDKVYAVGGFNGSLRVRTVDVYDPATDIWSTCNSMEARRSTLGVAVVNGCIYAVGGFDGTTGLCSAEVFDPKTRVWRFIDSMSTRRSSVGVGVVNGFLYAVGGYDGFSRQCLSSVERYNPDTDTWSPVTEMSARRSGAGVGVLNNVLYAVGGHDGPMVRKSVEAYDPETKKWHSVADMTFCRRNAGVVAHDGMLFVVGGDDGTSNLASVEVYCPETDTWRILPASMTIGRSYAGVCMIDKPIQATANVGGVVDDENSQAEGTAEGAVGYSRNNLNEGNNATNQNNIIINNNNNNQLLQQQLNHPYYENIYEFINCRVGGPNNANVAGASGAAAVATAANCATAAIAPADALQPNNNNNNNNNLNNEPVSKASDAMPNANPILATSPNLNHTQPRKLLATNNLNIGYRNDLYDRTNTAAYDVPRAVRSGLGFRRNFQLDLNGGNRFGTSRYSTTAGPLIYGSCQRQHSFDDTESQHYYNNMHYTPPLRYENIYEQIRDEPIYRNTGSGGRVYGRMNVIGHGIGRIERHLSSSCGNIDHYNLGGHYAVLGHSHFGTVGHIRLNAGASATTSGVNGVGSCAGGVGVSGVTYPKDSNNVKNSTSSFFSCLHGENSQSMSNIYRATAGSASLASNGGTPNLSKEREIRSASVGPLAATTGCSAAITSTTNSTSEAPSTSSAVFSRQTGTIPKIKASNGNAIKTTTQNTLTEKTLIIKNALTKKTSTATTQSSVAAAAQTEHSNSTLNRISKSSLQWLLVNKWLPLWIGQGPDCKVIDFNFMFSRDCVGCDGVSATSAARASPYASPRLGGMPHDIVRFNGRAEMHAPCAAAAATALRRDATGRPLRSTLNRLRDAELNTNRKYRHEDPSYENVHVQWHNGFEFGRSRDSEQAAYQPQQQQSQQQRPALQRARSESPNFSQGQRRTHTNSAKKPAKYGDPFKNYELNVESNTFKPKQAKMETVDCAEAAASTPTVVAAATEIAEQLTCGGGGSGAAAFGVDDIIEVAAIVDNIEECANLNDNESDISTTRTKTLNSQNNQNNNGANNNQKKQD